MSPQKIGCLQLCDTGLSENHDVCFIGMEYSWINWLLWEFFEFIALVLSLANQPMFKREVSNHNVCVYNLTITSACYGQHVEYVRREVQMVLIQYCEYGPLWCE